MYKEKLMEIGIPANLLGFEYLNDAIQIYNTNKQNIGKVYSDIAAKYDSSYIRVERSIRYAISQGNDPLANSEFIAKYKILWK